MSYLPKALCSNAALAVLVAVTLVGCAGFEAPAAPPFRDSALSLLSAQALVIPGQSTRGGVANALGPATVITFDSGFEVWAYREKSSSTSSASGELVILFAPSGIVTKTRVRPASALSTR